MSHRGSVLDSTLLQTQPLQWSRQILCIGGARLCGYIYGNICICHFSDNNHVMYEHNNTLLTNSGKINAQIAKIWPPSLILFDRLIFQGTWPRLLHTLLGGPTSRPDLLGDMQAPPADLLRGAGPSCRFIGGAGPSC